MGFWLWAAKRCLAKEKGLTKKQKERFFIDAEYSRAWDPDNKIGRGTREVFTVQLSKWLYERPKQDTITIDELIDFLYNDCVYLIRKVDSKPPMRTGALKNKRYS